MTVSNLESIVATFAGAWDFRGVSHVLANVAAQNQCVAR